MATVQINGKTYTGNNVTIRGNRVIIDGVDQDNELTTPVVELLIIRGVVQDVTTDASVECGQVTGSVHAGGSVNAKEVGGAVVAGGSVNCGKVAGSITAGGSVNHG